MDWEILLIENGSVDLTWQVCLNLRNIYPQHIKAIHEKNASYGLAIKYGLRHSKFSNIFIFNTDFWNINFLIQGCHLLEVCDIVVGSKTLIASDDLRPFIRRQLSYWFNMFLRITYNYPGTDTHGLKALKASVIKPIAESCYPMNELFDTQIILRACKKGLRYVELPVSVKEIRPSRYPKLQRVYNVFTDIVTIFRYRYL